MKDNFSNQAEGYSKYRPAYPEELFDFILQQFSERNSAWDCATGNGQTAKELAKYFNKVFATDISRKQLDQAVQADNISYSVQPAEQTNFPSAEFDLVTVSQALHWFRFDEFYTEVQRVVKPGGWIATWMYGLLRISPAIDKLIDEHHFTTLEKYWDPERKYVDDHYRSIPFPFEEIDSPAFHIRYHWTLEELEGYLNTWSALQKFTSANQYNPVTDLMKRIKPYWTAASMKTIFPLHLRMGRLVK
ncbi:MAG: class I SAM-dependent methyltransferase [Chitinophagaceae bacterium]